VEYATLHDLPLAAVQKMFSGTVAIVCPNGNGSAQFVGSHTVFTTSAHAFRSLIDCSLVNDPLRCSLVVPEKGLTKVKRLIASGYEDCSHLVLPEMDWAVLEIDSPMEEVVPYDLPGDDPHRPPEIEPVVVRVALGETNFLGGPRPDGASTVNPSRIVRLKIVQTTVFGGQIAPYTKVLPGVQFYEN